MNAPNPLVHFRGAERYNCAQAVLKTFAEAAGVGPACLENFTRFGSGRAPGGECGALFAAKAMLTSPLDRQALEERFAAEGGATQCRAIRRQGTLSCQGCVQLAAAELQRRLVEGQPLQRPATCESLAGTP